MVGGLKIDLRTGSLADVEVGEGETVKIRSWLGTHDKDLAPTPEPDPEA